MTEHKTELYLITPPKIDLAGFSNELAEALDAGPVACLQLRLKDVEDDEIRRATETLLPICHERGVPLLMNDRPDLGAETGCDGVHVGQEDTPYDEARRIMGNDAMIGVTCHDSRHLAIEAGEKGADYVAFGAFFATSTKAAKSTADPEILKWWSSTTEVPCVAIGGITVENCAPLIEAGADFLAVVSAIWDHAQGPGSAVKAFNAIF